jgi:hypothetical protein
MIDENLRQRIDKAESWSVQYQGIPYDDARQVEGRWYYRDLLTHEYKEFHSQGHVAPLFKNSPKKSAD